MYNIAIILGAGSGTRMKAQKSKLLLNLGEMSVIERTVRTFTRIKDINEVIVVCRESDFDAFEEVLGGYDISYCFGGATRQQSVMNALETIDECDYLIIHDGARPLVTESEIKAALDGAYKNGACALGVPVKDTIKVVDKNLQIVSTPDRSSLIAVRTPQIFEFNSYLQAARLAKEQGKDFTDDCRLLENSGKPVFIALGEYTNIKITTPEDIPTARAILEMRGDL